MRSESFRCFNNLAELYRAQERHREVGLLWQRGLVIREQQVWDKYSDPASSLNDLALLYHKQGKYAEAEPLYVRALAIIGQELGATHPDRSEERRVGKERKSRWSQYH